MPKPFRFSASLGALPADQIVTRARRAEELGYSSVTVPDHFNDQPAPLIALTAAATATTTLKVLPMVLANDYRNPLVAAKELATLDAVSNGRLEVGIGAGWMRADYDQAGMTYDSAGTRIARLAEAVDVYKTLLGGGSIDTPGQFYGITGALSQPLPEREGGPLLLLAGGKPKMLGLAGAKADIVGINPSLTAGVIDERAGADSTPARTDAKVEWIRDGAGRRFDDLEIQTRVHMTAITNEREKLIAELAPMMGIGADEALGSPHAMVGTVQQCIDNAQRWRERWGISYISINAESMNDFAPVVEALANT